MEIVSLNLIRQSMCSRFLSKLFLQSLKIDLRSASVNKGDCPARPATAEASDLYPDVDVFIC